MTSDLDGMEYDLRGLDACAWCGDPINCNETCDRDRIRQEEATAAIMRIRERARMRQFVVPEAPLPQPQNFGVNGG